MRRVIAVDPGGTTGIVCLDENRQEVEELEVVDWRDVPRIVRTLAAGAEVDVVVEDFIINSNTSNAYAYPLKCVGALEAQTWEHRRGRLYLQRAVDAKTTVPDEQLRVAGFWTGRSPHVRDAYRHLLLHLLRKRDPWATGKLMLGGE